MPQERNARSAQNANEDGEIDMTPMIDVTFLLLIFFMVTTLYVRPQKVNLPRAKHADAEDVQSVITINIDAKGDIYVPKDGQDPANPYQKVNSDELEAFAREHSGASFVLKGDQKLLSQEMLKIMDALAGSGSRDLRIGVAEAR